MFSALLLAVTAGVFAGTYLNDRVRMRKVTNALHAFFGEPDRSSLPMTPYVPARVLDDVPEHRVGELRSRLAMGHLLEEGTPSELTWSQYSQLLNSPYHLDFSVEPDLGALLAAIRLRYKDDPALAAPSVVIPMLSHSQLFAYAKVWQAESQLSGGTMPLPPGLAIDTAPVLHARLRAAWHKHRSTPSR